MSDCEKVGSRQDGFNRFGGRDPSQFRRNDVMHGPAAAPRRACPALDEEGQYLAALAAMTISEVSGDTLILSNEADQRLVFKRTAPGG